MRVENKVAVIVGGASGMARSAADALAAKGATIAIVDRVVEAGEQAAAEIGNGATFHQLDITDDAAVERVMTEVVDHHGAMHIAINTAGGGQSIRTIGRQGPASMEYFRGVVELNLIATFNLNRMQAWFMSKNEGDENDERGVIINTASIAAFEGQIGQVAYSAAKAGIAGMTLTMARDLGSMGIRVMTVAPSLFNTGLTKGIPAEMEAGLVADAAFPKRMGRPDEYATVAVAIVESPMLNGSTIRLDGGQRFAPK